MAADSGNLLDSWDPNADYGEYASGDYGTPEGAGSNTQLGSILGPLSKALGMDTSSLMRLLGGAAGGISSYITGQQNRGVAQQAVDLGAPERAQFRATTPESVRASMGPVLDQLADARARKWSMTSGNPANSPTATIATDQDMASLLLNQYNQERDTLGRTGFGLANPNAGYAGLTAANTAQGSGISGGIGAILNSLSGTKPSGVQEFVTLLQQNPQLLQLLRGTQGA